MSKRVPPIQFTKAELVMIASGVQQFMADWFRGYRSEARVRIAKSIVAKVERAIEAGGQEP